MNEHTFVIVANLYILTVRHVSGNFQKVSHFLLGFIPGGAKVSSFFKKNMPQDYQRDQYQLARKLAEIQTARLGFYFRYSSLKFSTQCVKIQCVSSVHHVNKTARSEQYQSIRSQLILITTKFSSPSLKPISAVALFKRYRKAKCICLSFMTQLKRKAVLQ